jgi:hypothetical protein
VSIRKGLVLLVVAGLFTGSTARADEVEGDTSVWMNTGETGFQTVTINVTVPTERDGDVLMKVAGDCEYDTKGIPNTSQQVVYGVGHATATPHHGSGVPGGVPISVGVMCRYINQIGQVMEINSASPGNTHAAPGNAVMTSYPIKMCIQVSVYYQSNLFVRNVLSCRDPVFPL